MRTSYRRLTMYDLIFYSAEVLHNNMIYTMHSDEMRFKTVDEYCRGQSRRLYSIVQKQVTPMSLDINVCLRTLLAVGKPPPLSSRVVF